MSFKYLLFYCRVGFEKDLASEIQAKTNELEAFGFPRFENNSGYVIFECFQQQDAERIAKNLPFNQLIFARQMLVCSEHITDLDPQDRVSPLLEYCQDFPLCGDIVVEHADTSDGKELSKFCRKFTVPLRQALRKRNKLTAKEQLSKPCLHVFVTSTDSVFIGYSFAHNHSPYPLGILRLKFPHQAPSRSTLKLDEAIQIFIPENEQAERLKPGLHAVDLGACPGGWTYQLVRRGMFVQAVDNGAMDEALMETGQVSYFAHDGFKYKPKKNNVYWLVCDMIEQPQRVAKLMANWVEKGWCKEAIFNLKLPMKRRYESVTEALEIIHKVFNSQANAYQLQAKHLYHDREEITLHLRSTGFS